jgi:hypothetical protein
VCIYVCVEDSAQARRLPGLQLQAAGRRRALALDAWMESRRALG